MEKEEIKKEKRKEEIRKGERWQGKHNTKIRCKDVASLETVIKIILTVSCGRRNSRQYIIQ